LDEIAQIGPGGSFLTSDLTLKLFRQAYHHSDIFPKLTLEDWQARGCPRAEDLVRQHCRQLLNEAVAAEDHADLIARGEAFIDAHVAQGL
jgi:trimethylamine:corrinoid methyltransferase-like protein